MLHVYVAELRARLLEREVCMIFLLVEAPQDRLMAYRHARPSSRRCRLAVYPSQESGLYPRSRPGT